MIRIANATSLILEAGGTYTNDGTLNINGTGSTTQLKVSGGTVTLGGTGAITLSDRTANRIIGVVSTDVIELSSGQSLSGAGQIGVNFTGLTNRGLINATGVNTLTIDPSATGVLNTGTIKATGSGGLILTGGTFTNFEGALDGLIEAAGATVTVTSSTVSGGDVTLTGAGTLKLNTATISGGTLDISTTGLLETTSGTSTIGGGGDKPLGRGDPHCQRHEPDPGGRRHLYQ